jgi:deoxyhypusine synthase
MLNIEYPEQNGLLHAAARAGVPVFIPSFSDCEIGLDFNSQNLSRRKEGEPEIMFDAFGDWEEYVELIRGAKTLGIITLGGGVPRNWAQQVGPFCDILTEKHLAPKNLLVRFRYAVRICTASSTEAGLSGCSYSEGRSWGKFVEEGKGGQFAEVVADYSTVLPLLVAAILEGAQ